MVIYSIKDLEKVSGIKAHTLRIWEKRYGLVSPKRTKSNIRYYTEEDMRHILNVCFLYKKGYKISKIAELPPDELKQKVSGYTNIQLSFEDQIDALLLFVMELDNFQFEQILDQHIRQKGLEETMTSVIYPFLERLGMAWLSGSFSQMHEAFVTQIIRSKIIAQTENIPCETDYKAKYVIYLPPSEGQELSLLYFQYLLKKNNCRCVNLGTNIQLNDVTHAIDTIQPDYVFTIINENQVIPLQSYLNQLSEHLDKTRLLITGYQTVAPDLRIPAGVVKLASLSEAVGYVETGQLGAES